MNRWSKAGVLNCVFEQLQRNQIVRIKIEAVSPIEVPPIPSVLGLVFLSGRFLGIISEFSGGGSAYYGVRDGCSVGPSESSVNVRAGFAVGLGVSVNSYQENIGGG